ncbi:MAG: ACP S-malonyltransferase, partial [Candidatus Neomarinimicrobiota bacterium]|nr:ACP S-malonyltransferase [Candidatus Neomarinimicrobiota bacterium]
QPAIYIVSVIIGKLLIENGAKPSCAAGHSLGEYSALTLAGSFDFKTGLNLVKIRALEMQKAGKDTKGTMAAILGLDDDIVSDICRDYNEGVVVAANYNAKGQVVISGEIESVKNTMDKMLSAGASKAIELNVSGAFHSPLMSDAKEALTQELLSIDIKDSKIPVYANVSSKSINKSSNIRQALIDQLDQPVKWHQTVTNMMTDGVKSAIEVGPGRVLKGLSKRINPSLNMISVESHEEIVNFEYV